MKWIMTWPLAAAFAVICFRIPATADAEVTQFSIILRLCVQMPTLPNATGVSREEFAFDDTRDPVTAPLTYPAAAMPGDAVLTVRAHTDDARERPADLSFLIDAGHIEITRH